MRDKHAKIKKIVEKYQRLLGLEDYLIDVMICEDKHTVKNKRGEIGFMETDYDAEVIDKNFAPREYSIVINKSALSGDLDETIGHEMLHILLWGFADMVDTLIPLTGMPDNRQYEYLNNLLNREHEIIGKLIKTLKAYE